MIIIPSPVIPDTNTHPTDNVYRWLHNSVTTTAVMHT